MCAQAKDPNKSQPTEARLLKIKIGRSEEALRSMCITLAEIQHLFGDEEFETLMGHVSRLEEAVKSKKKLVGS